jgi:hypothetical protein
MQMSAVGGGAKPCLQDAIDLWITVKNHEQSCQIATTHRVERTDCMQKRNRTRCSDIGHIRILRGLLEAFMGNGNSPPPSPNTIRNHIDEEHP